MAQTRVSLIIPVHSEGSLLTEIFPSFAAELRAQTTYLFDLTFVNDGGDVETTAAMTKLLPSGHGVVSGVSARMIHFTINQGKGAAVRAGLAQAKGDYLIYLDGDLTYGVREVMRMVNELASGHPFVKVVRKSRAGESLLRRFLSKGAELCAVLVMGGRVRDPQSGLKGMAAKCKPYTQMATIPGFLFDTELLAILNSYRVPIHEIEVEVHPAENSSVSMRSILNCLVAVPRVFLVGLVHRWRARSSDARYAKT